MPIASVRAKNARSWVTIAKGQALGNDYLVVERERLPWALTPAHTRLICDRHRGVGSDGLLVVDADEEPVRLRIYNPDGSEAEKSGNGLRILGAWLHHTGRVSDRDHMTVLEVVSYDPAYGYELRVETLSWMRLDE